jgi:hypothetical protein
MPPIIRTLVGIDTLRTLNVVFKWACDGASGQNQYKQLFVTTQEDVDDAYTFVVSIVPLQMTTYSAIGSSTSQQNHITTIVNSYRREPYNHNIQFIQERTI